MEISRIKDFLQGIENTTIYAEKLYSINLRIPIDDMKKTGLNKYAYDFNIDYYAIAVDDILGIHKYLMEKNNIL